MTNESRLVSPESAVTLRKGPCRTGRFATNWQCASESPPNGHLCVLIIAGRDGDVASVPLREREGETRGALKICYGAAKFANTRWPALAARPGCGSVANPARGASRTSGSARFCAPGYRYSLPHIWLQHVDGRRLIRFGLSYRLQAVIHNDSDVRPRFGRLVYRPSTLPAVNAGFITQPTSCASHRKTFHAFASADRLRQ